MSEHWMTFATFNEQEFFTYPQADSYHGVILNANMVAHAPAGIAAFLLEKVHPETEFLIDPLTHAFQHNPATIMNERGPKSSIKNLAAEYGEVVTKFLGQQPLTAEAIRPSIDDFSTRVIEYQWNFLSARFLENENAKYLDDGEAIRRPSVVVAPYFYLTEENFRSWLPIMQAGAIRSIAVASGYQPQPKVYSAVVIDRVFLQKRALLDEIVVGISAFGVRGVLLWVDNFDENTASSLELMGFVALCSGLSGAHLEVLNLHGGYFSCLLSSPSFGEKLTGVSHGPEFGESRSVVPVGGGIPISRFYVPDLHLRSKFRDFLPIALRKNWLVDAQTFHREVCSCQECLDVLKGDVENFQLYGESEVKSIKRKYGVVRIEFPSVDAKKRCLRHYLCKKVKEFEFVARNDKAGLLNDLAESHRKFHGSESAETISHLLRWRHALDQV